MKLKLTVKWGRRKEVNTTIKIYRLVITFSYLDYKPDI